MEETTMSIHDQLVACIARADEAARAKEYRKVLLALEHAEFKAALLGKGEKDEHQLRP